MSRLLVLAALIPLAAPAVHAAPDGRVAAPAVHAAPDGRVAAPAQAPPDERVAAPAVHAAPDGRVAAPAQAPPDERAAARAFADAGLRFQAELERIQDELAFPSERRERRCARRARRRIAERHWDEVILLGEVQEVFRPVAQLLDPALTRFSLELHAVQTADAALRGGRTAIRRARRAYAAVLTVPPIDVCAEIRRWVDGGFEPTPAIRRERRTVAALERLGAGDLQRRLRRTVERLREHGIPAPEAEAFDGDNDS